MGSAAQWGRKTVESPVRVGGKILGRVKNEGIEPCRFCEDREGRNGRRSPRLAGTGASQRVNGLNLDSTVQSFENGVGHASEKDCV